jgi:DNA-binding CsgD family transcriptional regulator
LGLLASRDAAPVVSARASAAAGRVATAGGSWDEAAGCFSAALRILRRLDLPFEAGCVQLLLARVETRTEPALAVEDARAALAAFDRLGARSQADATAALLRSLGVRPRSGVPSADLLTAREREVLDLVALGLSNPEIAARLFISRKTAAHHVSSVLAKIGVRSRTEAVAVRARAQAENGRSTGERGRGANRPAPPATVLR